MANKAAGKGYESTDFYENVKFQFVGIENIHVMRQSLQKMIECKYHDEPGKTATEIYYAHAAACACLACYMLHYICTLGFLQFSW